jgi:hypothetical protein
MQPYTVSEAEWISRIPVTPSGAIDVVALEAAARRERSRLVAGLFARLFSRGKRRAQAKAVQAELDRAALA